LDGWKEKKEATDSTPAQDVGQRESEEVVESVQSGESIDLQLNQQLET